MAKSPESRNTETHMAETPPEAAERDDTTTRSTETPPETAERVPLHAPDLLRWCVSLLATSAWQALGLIPDPATNKVERNLDDARLAIDATASLVEHLRPRLQDAERREFDNLLANLRLNFVEQRAKTEGGSDAGKPTG